MAPVVDLARRQKVGLVQHDRHRRPVRLQRPQVAVVQGSVGVLLGLDDPEDEIGELDDTVDLEPVRGLDGVEVRQVEEQQSLQSTVLETVAAPDLEPVQQRIRAIPHAAAWPSDVVGRRRPTVASSAPESALKSSDLPTVGPASATPVSRRRGRGALPLPSTARAAWTASGSSRPSATWTASASAVSLRSSPAHEARRTASTAECRRASPSASVAAPSTSASKRAASVRSGSSARSTRSAGLGGELAHGLVAEERLEHLLAERRRPARNDNLDAGEASGVREHRQHRQPCTCRPSDASQPRRRRGLSLPARAPSVALPGAHLLLGLHPQALRCPPELGRGLEQRLARRVLAPGARNPLRRPLRRRLDDRLEPVLDRDRAPRPPRLAGEDALQPVTGRSDAGLQRPHHVTGSDDVVPACEHLASKERAAPQGVLDLARAPACQVVSARSSAAAASCSATARSTVPARAGGSRARRSTSA